MRRCAAFMVHVLLVVCLADLVTATFVSGLAATAGSSFGQTAQAVGGFAGGFSGAVLAVRQVLSVGLKRTRYEQLSPPELLNLESLPPKLADTFSGTGWIVAQTRFDCGWVSAAR